MNPASCRDKALVFGYKENRDLLLIESGNGTFYWWKKCDDYCWGCDMVFKNKYFKIVGMVGSICSEASKIGYCKNE